MKLASFSDRLSSDDDWRPRYGVVLLLISATFVCLSTLPSTAWALSITLLLQGVTLVVTLRTSRARPAVLRVAYIVTFVAVVGGLALLFAAEGGQAPTGVRNGTFLITAALVSLSVPVIVAGIWRDLRVQRAVSLQVLLGAVCIYLLVGLFFTIAYGAVANIDGAAFFTDGTDGDSRIRTYFSFVTLTTLGYGDFAPAEPIGRTLATVEALIGQIYLVTIIGVVVGKLGQGPGRRDS